MGQRPVLSGRSLLFGSLLFNCRSVSNSAGMAFPTEEMAMKWVAFFSTSGSVSQLLSAVLINR